MSVSEGGGWNYVNIVSLFHRNCPYRDEFAREKVIWSELVEVGRFAVDDSRLHVDSTAYMLNYDKPKSICALLNSTVSLWYVRKTAPTSGMGATRWKKSYIEMLPLIRLDCKAQNQLNDEVEDLLLLLSAGDLASTKVKHTAIDKEINRLYGISSEEENFLRNSVYLTKA